MTEAKPSGVADHDHIAPPETTEFIRVENEGLKQSLLDSDFATFWVWLKTKETEVSHDPVEHAKLLSRAAGICHAANKDDFAQKYLLDAARIVRKKDSEMEEQVVALLQEFCGEPGLKALAEQFRQEAGAAHREELEAVKKEYAEVQTELIALGSRDWEKKTEEQIARIAELKVRLQELTNSRAKLMQ